jgi:predicted AAA+ superfamily ATPase
MKRRAYQDLVRWKSSPYRKPLIIQGARQVGKTHLMRQFGASEFDSVAYFNFESRPELHPVFSQSLDPERIISSLNLLSDIH